MVAVDGSKESEHAVEWTIGHLCRSGDLLHIVHVETAGDMVDYVYLYFRMGNCIDVVFFCLSQLFGDDAAAVQVRDDEGCERRRDGDGRDDSHRRRFAHEGVPSIGQVPA